MKRILLLLMAAGILPAAQPVFSLPAPASITITNPSGTARNEEVVEIPYQQVSSFAAKDGNFRLINKQTGKEVPYQLAYEGNEQPKWLLVQVSVPAHGIVILNAAAGKPVAVKARTY
ncbi:MAG TPA: DUF4861 family protein, partial [Chitinophaga sp.]|nr:DUF4861 family protein [Chitinophaga sp.]